MNLEMRFSRFFWVACAIELALLPVAAVMAFVSGQALFSDLHWNLMDLLVGLVATIPLLGLFWWALTSSRKSLVRIRQRLEALRPLFESWSLVQLGVISILAGVCEEVLFRSVIQGSITAFAGPALGLLLASVLFGCAHLVTLAYGIIATTIGIYIGLLWLLGGNLLIPIVTHAVYDFVALMCLLRWWRT